MTYIEYEQYKQKYNATLKEHEKLIDEKEKLFLLTQPKATAYDKEKVKGGTPVNTFDEYLIKKEKKELDQKLEESQSILNERIRLLNIKREELNQSKDEYDILYKYKYIDNLKVRVIYKKMAYCRASVYNMLNEIRKNIKFRQN